MNYKTEFYARYQSSHILLRENEVDLATFQEKAGYYQKVLAPLLPSSRSAKIIDIGCGDGSLVWWLQQLGFTNATGIDVSDEQIALARRLGVRHVEQADLLPFLQTTDQCYDLIILRDVIEHFPKDDVIELLSKCFLRLNNQGTVIIQTVNACSPFFGRIRYGDFTHDLAFTDTSLQQLLTIIGFSRPAFFASTIVRVKGLRSFLRFFLWKIAQAFAKLFIYAETGRTGQIVSESIIAVAHKNTSLSANT